MMRAILHSCLQQFAGYWPVTSTRQERYREPWSSGQAEGQINRLKTLKGMFGGRHRTVAGANAALQ